MVEPMKVRDAASRALHKHRNWFHRWFYKRDLEFHDYCYSCAGVVDEVFDAAKRACR